MARCQKCLRAHSGICGIPAGVTLGFGARRIGSASRDTSGEGHPIQGKPSQTRHSTGTLEGMLAQSRIHLAKVLETLKAAPRELPEYGELLDREAALAFLIKQLISQIAMRR